MAKFSELDWTANDMAEEFKIFKQRMELCILDNGLTAKAKIATKIKLAIGPQGLRKLNASSLTEDDKKEPEKLWNLFEEQLNIKVNFRVHRLELMRYKQKPGETLDNFINRCREKARDCDFSEEEISERIIELVINSTPYELFQKTS